MRSAFSLSLIHISKAKDITVDKVKDAAIDKAKDMVIEKAEDIYTVSYTHRSRQTLYGHHQTM